MSLSTVRDKPVEENDASHFVTVSKEPKHERAVILLSKSKTTTSELSFNIQITQKHTNKFQPAIRNFTYFIGKAMYYPLFYPIDNS
jgi:hypothetical protein